MTRDRNGQMLLITGTMDIECIRAGELRFVPFRGADPNRDNLPCFHLRTEDIGILGHLPIKRRQKAETQHLLDQLEDQ